MLEGSFFSFTPTALKKEVESFAETALSLITSAGLLPVWYYTSIFRAATTSGSLFTHALYHCDSRSRTSTQTGCDWTIQQWPALCEFQCAHIK